MSKPLYIPTEHRYTLQVIESIGMELLPRLGAALREVEVLDDTQPWEDELSDCKTSFAAGLGRLHMLLRQATTTREGGEQ